jgi:anti-sigma regulatory factor (Ser/Thr protein kinase)
MHPHQLRLEVCSDPRLLGVIRGVLRGWMEAFDLGGDKRHEVILAVDEACSNAMRHAYQGRCDESVELVLAVSEDWLEFTVSDQGSPCPPEAVQRRPMETPDIDRLKPGGLGVKLIHEVFDEVTFHPGENAGNRVTMRLRRGSDKRG